VRDLLMFGRDLGDISLSTRAERVRLSQRGR
jgi:hypothetical protein